MLCREKDEMIKHIVSNCSKLARKEYKSRHDWMGKVIHLDLCKILNLVYAQTRICFRECDA